MRDKPEWIVTVVDRSREFLNLRARNRVTGKIQEKSSETTNRRDAGKAAGVWQDQLNDARYVAPSKMLLSEAFDRFEQEYLVSRRKSTADKARYDKGLFVKLVGDVKLSGLTTARIGEFIRAYRAEHKVSDASVASVLRNLKVLARWLYRQGLLPVLPHFEMPPKSGSKMKGRGITTEEFDRLILVVNKVRPDDAAAWELFLKGLWLSGLRIGEALQLAWDQDAPIRADLSGKYPLLRIKAAYQKGDRDTTTPITPDFADLLKGIPQGERNGRVFKLLVRQREKASAIVAAIGKKAGVIVGADHHGKKRHATAHDLRRAFAVRWSRLVMPQQLQQLMRHSSITTTMTFYAGGDVDGAAEAVWKTVSGDKTGDKSQKSKTDAKSESTQTVTQ